VEISRRSYGTDPRLRAFFVSAEDLQEVLGGIKTVKDYLQGVSGPLPDAIFGLLSMAWKERTVLGTEQQGDILRATSSRWLSASSSTVLAGRPAARLIFAGN
jgi:hypothetical protein